MFTSRAEYRLLLRADNADQRLTGRGIALGLVGGDRAQAFRRKQDALAAARTALTAESLSPQQLAGHGIAVNQDGVRRTALDLLALPEGSFERVAAIFPAARGLPLEIVDQLRNDSLYAGYLKRQEADIRAFRRDEGLKLPADLDYGRIGGLSAEARQKLAEARPPTLGAASRIPGITPAALTALLRYVERTQALAEVG
jgi:tRNA uridine 5-carboxymethylaminomethyl modification enzyme